VVLLARQPPGVRIRPGPIVTVTYKKLQLPSTVLRRGFHLDVFDGGLVPKLLPAERARSMRLAPRP